MQVLLPTLCCPSNLGDCTALLMQKKRGSNPRGSVMTEIEDLVKAKHQYELAADLLSIVIEEQRRGERDSRVKHQIQAADCADAGTDIL